MRSFRRNGQFQAEPLRLNLMPTECSPRLRFKLVQKGVVIRGRSNGEAEATGEYWLAESSF